MLIKLMVRQQHLHCHIHILQEDGAGIMTVLMLALDNANRVLFRLMVWQRHPERHIHILQEGSEEYDCICAPPIALRPS